MLLPDLSSCSNGLQTFSHPGPKNWGQFRPKKLVKESAPLEQALPSSRENLSQCIDLWQGKCFLEKTRLNPIETYVKTGHFLSCNICTCINLSNLKETMAGIRGSVNPCPEILAIGRVTLHVLPQQSQGCLRNGGKLQEIKIPTPKSTPLLPILRDTLILLIFGYGSKLGTPTLGWLILN